MSTELDDLCSAALDLAEVLAKFEEIAYNQHRIADQLTYDAARDLTLTAHRLLELPVPTEGIYRVRLMGITESPHDLELQTCPARGDYIATDGGTLRVLSRVYNLDPGIPCDWILFVIPDEPVDAEIEADDMCAFDCGSVAEDCRADPCDARLQARREALKFSNPGREEEDCDCICKRCHQHHDLHDRDELACPLIPAGTGFSDTGRYTT